MPHIDTIEVIILDVPTIRGHVLAMTTMRKQSFVIVQIRFSDGSIGTGEGTTIGGLSYCSESPESICSAIQDYIAPLILKADGDNPNALIAMIERSVRGNPIARAAVEMALWDGFARRRNMSLSALFGGALRTSMPVAWTLASGTAETDIEEAKEMIASRRHNIFKLKIGKRPVRHDIEHVAAIKAALGDQASIRVDVNQAWSLTEARWGVAGLDEIGIDLIEQPVAATDIAAMAELTAGYRVAIMADEALSGPVTAQKVASARAADVFAVKIMQSGGLKRAQEVCALANASGIGVYGGTMLESGLGTAAALHVFACADRLDWGCEFFGPLLFTDEILQQPIRFGDFHVHVPQGDGNGVDLDMDKVNFYRRDSAVSEVRTVAKVS